MSVPPVVRVFATTQSSDYDCPWQALAPENSSGSGVVVDDNRVLTGAHVVADATFLQVQKISSPEKAIAHVTRVCHDCDLALLEIEDDHFTDDIEPAALGDFPSRSDKVTVIGFPIGGEEVSITEGVVSRIEVQNYDHSQRNLLAVTVDAAINSGNSGGPVFKDGRLVGIAFQKLSGDVDNIGEMVPVHFIERFIEAKVPDKQIRIPGLGIRTQTLESPLLRKHLKMSGSESGVLVRAVHYGSSSHGSLKQGDALLSIDGYSIANNGTIQYLERFRTKYDVVLGDHDVGDKISIELFRDGRRVSTELTLQPDINLVPRSRYDVRPSYFIFGGLVFQPLTRDFLSTWDEWDERAPADFLSLYESGVRTAKQQEIVLLSRILADETTVGFESRNCEIVHAVNGSPVIHLADLVKRLRTAKGIVEFTTSKGLIVVDAEKLASAQQRIIDRYQIPSVASFDLGTPR